jgi:small GTP-binding protein
MEKHRFIKKVCLLGDGAVGKTSLMRRYVYDFFGDEYLMSFGTKVTKKVLDLDEVELTLMIWDVLGQKTHKSLHEAYYKGAKGALLVCDLTREDTVRHLIEWKNDFYHAVGQTPIVPIANKCDLEWKVSPSDLDEVSKALGKGFMPTSAKTGEGVESVFLQLGTAMMEKME